VVPAHLISVDYESTAEEGDYGYEDDVKNQERDQQHHKQEENHRHEDTDRDLPTPRPIPYFIAK